MKKKGYRNIMIYSAALVIFAGLFFFTFQSRVHRSERRTVQIVAFGDSLFGLVRDETAIPAQVGKLMGMTVFNGGFGGTCVSRIDTDYRLDQFMDSFSLVALAKSVAADDFGVQQSAKIRQNGTEYYEEALDQLAQIDFSGVELVLIEHGLNDYYMGIPISNLQDPYDEYSFIGAWRNALEFLRRANPQMRIVLVTPTYTWHLASNRTCEEYGGDVTQEDYIRAEMELAEELGIEVIDVYHDVYPNEKWEDWALYTLDGFHPNEAGRELLAGIIADYLKQPQ